MDDTDQYLLLEKVWAGFKAHNMGDMIIACPYMHEEDQRPWYFGWRMADMQAKKRRRTRANARRDEDISGYVEAARAYADARKDLRDMFPPAMDIRL